MNRKQQNLGARRATVYETEDATENWACIDCGVNTAPGMMNKKQLEHALAAANGQGIEIEINILSEVYMVKPAVWKAAGMDDFSGCLCVGCLERRLGRILNPKDFLNHVFNSLPGTKRLLARRDGGR
jgi:hypothetical protein